MIHYFLTFYFQIMDFPTWYEAFQQRQCAPILIHFLSFLFFFFLILLFFMQFKNSFLFVLLLSSSDHLPRNSFKALNVFT